jgi:hypothetical protein
VNVPRWAPLLFLALGWGSGYLTSWQITLAVGHGRIAAATAVHAATTVALVTLATLTAGTVWGWRATRRASEVKP